jgi:hypothetical protein
LPPQKILLNIVTEVEFVASMPTEVLEIVRLEMDTLVNPLAVITAVDDPGFWRIVLAVSLPAIGRLFFNVMDSVYVPRSTIILSIVVMFAALMAAAIVVKHVVEEGLEHTLLTVKVVAWVTPGMQTHSSARLANASSMMFCLRNEITSEKIF